MGQLFHVVIVPIGSDTPIYNGEAMHRSWKDSDKGKMLGLWLDEEADRHPFAGCKKRSGKDVGSLFMGVFVLVDSDSSAVNDEQAEKVRNTGRKLSSQIHLMITSPRFCKFMQERSQRTQFLQQRNLTWDSIHKGEMMTKSYVKSFLKIESLAVLDTDPEKAERFHKVFREPFARWNGDDVR